MIDILDAIARIVCLILLIRGLCVLNRMGYRHWSAFSFPVFGLVVTTGYVVFNGAQDKEVTYPILLLMVCLLCLLDKRRTTARREKR